MERVSNPHLKDRRLSQLAAKIAAGKRLGFDDGMTIFCSPDFLGVGKLADQVKQRLYGDRVTFVLNRQINPTNLCALSCRFCDFAKRPGQAGAYEMGMGEMVEMARGATEIHIVGGLHPEWPYSRYLDMVRAIRSAYPSAQIKAFTAIEIDFFSRLAKKPVSEVLADLRSVGLNTMPGGGAEVFSERVRRLLFPQKIGAERWLAVHREAHRQGIPTNVTLLYGHVETVEERVEHLLRVRELQDETGGFLAFVPLSFQLGENGVASRWIDPADDLRTIAAARLLLDNVPHIKAYWIMLGMATAAAALNFGADDIDGTIGHERIAHAAGAGSPEAAEEARLVEIIREAGQEPVRRDALYRTTEQCPAG